MARTDYGVPLDFIINSDKYGEVLVDIKDNKKILRLDISENEHILKQHFSKTFIEVLKKYNGSTLKNKRDIELIFNHELLQIEITADLKYYSQRNIQVIESSNYISYGKSPSSFSSYINLRANYQKENHSDFSTFRVSPNINIKSYVLEGEFLYNSSDEKKITRGPLRLVKDDQKRALRYSVGDIQYSGISFMSPRSLGGVMVSKEFSITPNVSTAPVGEKEFILYESAKVTFYVNNRLTQILELSKGRYNATNFPIADGVNEIRVEIEYYDGRKETLIFPFVTSFELLKKGLTQYNMAIGFNEDLGDDNKSYTNEKTFSAFYKYGLLADLNLSGFIQLDQNQIILGTDVLFATVVGKFRFETALSQIGDSKKSGIGLRGNYYHQSFNKKNHYIQDIALRYEYLSPHFSRLGQLDPNNLYSHTLSTNYKKQMTNTSFINLGLAQLLSHDNSINSLSRMNIGYQSIFYKKLNLSINFAYNQIDSQKFDQIVTIFANYSFDDHKHYSSLYYDSLSRTSRISGRGNYETRIGQLYSNITLEKNHNTSKLAGRIDHRHSRIESYIGYDLDKPTKESQLRKRHNMRVGLATSLSYVDGELAVGRPIANSFVIITQKDSDINEKLIVNPREGGASPKTDKLGNLVLTNLSEYQTNNIFIDASEIKDGSDFMPKEYQLKPTYKSGFLINLKTTKSYNINATIRTKDNLKLGLIWGSLKRIPENDINEFDLQKIQFFTDENASTYIFGVSAGTYEMIIHAKNDYKSKIVIKKASRSEIELGDIYVK